MKILITSDIHIHDYTDYNIEPDYRLNSFSRLAHRLVEIAKEHDCKKVFLAGDILHRASEPPKTNHKAKEFFEILNNHFTEKNFHYILGQHDCAYKSNDAIFEGSNIHVIARGLARYEHKKILEIDGRKIAFRDWSPIQDLSWIEDQVDLFVGHVTISEMFGQEIDNSKFKLGICGDIHTPTKLDNLHSCNVPIPHYISDCQDGSVIVYDTEDNSFIRVKTESESFKYVKIFYDDVKGVNFDDPLTFAVRRPTKTVSTETVFRSIDLEKVISNIVESQNLSKLHSDIISEMQFEDTKPIDLNFSIKRLRIKNFKSIGDFEMEIPSGFIALTAKNGLGKSTLLSAIDFAFRPPRSSRDLIKIGKKNLEVEIEFDYKGRSHVICRGSGSDSFANYFIDGELQESSSIAETNKIIENNLEFLKLFDILYRYQNAPYLLSGFNYSQRIDLVSKLLGLGKIDLIYLKSNSIKKSISSELEQLNFSISTRESRLSDIDTSRFFELDDRKSIEDKQLEFKNQQSELNREISRIQETNSEVQRHNSLMSKLRSSSENLKKSIEEIKTNYSDFSLDSFELDLSEGESYLQVLESNGKVKSEEISKLNTEISNLKHEIGMKKRELDSIDLNSKFCSSCGREFENADQIQDHYDKEKLAFENLNKLNSSKIEELNLRLNPLESELSEINTNKSGVSKELNEMKSFLNIYKSDMERLKRLEEELEEILPKIQEDKQLVDSTDLIQKISYLESNLKDLSFKLFTLDEIEKQRDKFNQISSELEDLRMSSNLKSQELKEVERYSKLFHPTGSIVKSVFYQVAELLTDNDFVVRTVKTLASGEDRIDFDIDMNIDSNLIPYSNLSGGQKVLCDIFFLTKLFKMSGRVGLFMLDETLRDLDINNLEKASVMIKNSPINTIFLVTHVESFNYYDLKFNIEKIQGSSVYTIEGRG